MAPSHTRSPLQISPGRNDGLHNPNPKVTDGRLSSNGIADASLPLSHDMGPPNSYVSRTDSMGGPVGSSSGSNFPGDPYASNASERPPNGSSNGGQGIIVRGEEIGIVVVVLLLWVGAIILFFNRWGKIRMLEPYQPKFCEDHRPSCPMAEVTTVQQYPRTFSKCNISADLIGSPHFAKCNYHGITSGYGLGPSIGIGVTSRPRQNSVFVTSPHSAAMAINSSVLQKASRKTKSAIDLSTLVLSEEFLENDEESEEKDEEESKPLTSFARNSQDEERISKV